MQILKTIFIILEVLVLFNLLIFVHELGHFLAARWRGLKIDRFAIWFGTPIWKKKINGVEYALGTIPAGGYVALPQMATMEGIEGKGDEPAETLPPISPLDKIIVAFAGPLFSFLLAMAFAVVVWGVGRPVTESETSTTIGLVYKDGPAEKAGLRAGDKIVSVDGRPVSKFGGMGDSISWRVVRSEGDTIPVEVLRNGELKKFEVTPVVEERKAWQRKGLRQILIEPAQSAIIAKIYSNSPAAIAGLRVKDQVTEVNGFKPIHYAQIGELLETNGNQKVNLTVLRGGETLHFTLQPEVPINPPDIKEPRLGILWMDGGKTTIAHPAPVEQVVSSLNAMLDTFGALFAKKSHIQAQQLGGAIKIISVYYTLFERESGWRLALWFSVLMNVNLAVLNMLPFPVLDGGHIMLALVEAARRKPISGRILNWLQTACAMALIGYMLYIAFFDIQDIGGSRMPEMEFAPPKTQAK